MPTTPAMPKLGGFLLLEELGRGARGIIYRAKDAKGQDYAIKVSLPMLDSSHRARFIRDGLAQKSLRSKHIVKVFDVLNIPEQQGAIIMEYMPGGKLTINRHAPFVLATELEVARQIIKGLADGHAQGVLHSDIKLENVLHDGRGRIALSDFSSDRLDVTFLRDSVLSEPVAVSTLAPEWIEHGKIIPSKEADIYLLGLVLFELFTRKKPLPSMRTPSELNPVLPQSLDEMLRRCLHDQPEKRPGLDELYSFVEELLRQLSREGSKQLLSRERYHFLRGELAYSAGDLAGAADAFKIALNYDPGFHQASKRLMLMQAKLGNFAEVLELGKSLEAALEHEVDRVELAYDLIEIAMLAFDKNQELGHALFELACSLPEWDSTDLAAVKLLYVDALLDNKNKLIAAKQLCYDVITCFRGQLDERAEALDTLANDALSYIELTEALPKPRKIRRFLRNARWLTGCVVQHNQAVANAALGNYDRAKSIVEKILIEENPVLSESYTLLALMQFASRRYSAALDALEAVRKLTGRLTFSNIALAMAISDATKDVLLRNEVALLAYNLTDVEELSKSYLAGLKPEHFVAAKPPLARIIKDIQNNYAPVLFKKSAEN